MSTILGAILHFKEFIIGLIGALLGGFFTLLGTLVAQFLENRREISKEKRELKGVLQAFHTELQTLWERYLSTAGQKVEDLSPGNPLLMYWPITQDYFTIYSTNARKIGEIEDPRLRKLLVTAYIRSRGLIDSFRMNNAPILLQ